MARVKAGRKNPGLTNFSIFTIRAGVFVARKFDGFLAFFSFIFLFLPTLHATSHVYALRKKSRKIKHNSLPNI